MGLGTLGTQATTADPEVQAIVRRAKVPQVRRARQQILKYRLLSDVFSTAGPEVQPIVRFAWVPWIPRPRQQFLKYKGNALEKP